METKVRCKHCAGWIPSFITFESIEAFNSASLHGNNMQCPSCGKMTRCDKKNMKAHWVDEDGEGGEGGFLGIEIT